MKLQIPHLLKTGLRRSACVSAILLFCLTQFLFTPAQANQTTEATQSEPTAQAKAASTSAVTPPKVDYIVDKSALIAWETKEASGSQVEYSTDPNFGTSLLTPADSNQTTGH